MNIYLVRHGETEANTEGIYCGATDTELTKTGLQQTLRTISYLKKIKTDKIYSSPLLRARKIARGLNRSSVYDSRISERSFGIWEGLSYNLICDMYPEEAEQWKRNWTDYKIPQGESCLDVDKRCRDFLHEITSHEKDCIVITHSGVIRNIITLLLNMPLEAVWRFKIDNGSVTHIQINNGYAVLCGLNYVP